MFVDGEAGVGKTALVKEFTAEAIELGATVLIGACVELAAEDIPLAPIIAALRGPGRDRQAAAGEFAEVLGYLLPQQGGEFDPRDLPSQARLFQSLLATFERAAEARPLILVLEDLHWADRSTLNLLDMLARGLDEVPILVIGTFCADEVQRRHPLRALLAELDRLEVVNRLRLGRFSEAQTGELVSALLGERSTPRLIKEIFERTGGNAFFVEELARAVRAGSAAGLAERLQDLLLARVERMSESARNVVSLVAIAGRRVPHEALSAAFDEPSDILLKAVREAVDAYVLEPEEDGYAFRHELVREAVAGNLLPGERLLLHRAYAEALEARPDLLPAERLAADLAHHWLGADQPAKALPALLNAAAAAERAHAFAEQYQLLRRVLDIWPRLPSPQVDRLAVLDRLIFSARHSGNQQRALEHIEQALAEASSQDRPDRAATLLTQRARILLNMGLTGALPVMEEAAVLVPPLPGASARPCSTRSAPHWPSTAKPSAPRAWQRRRSKLRSSPVLTTGSSRRGRPWLWLMLSLAPLIARCRRCMKCARQPQLRVICSRSLVSP